MLRSQYTAVGIIVFALFALPSSALAVVSINQVYSEIEVYWQLPTGVLAKIANAESGGNPNARSQYSTAVGLFQWLETSWLYATKALYGASLHLDSRTDPVTSAKVTAFSLAQAKDKNGPLIAQAKIDMILGLYMGHFLGPAGAAKFLTAYIQNPNANAASIFVKEAQSNQTIFSSRTLAEVLNVMASKLKVAGVSVNVAGNFSDSMGISMARSDADVGMTDFYPPTFVPTGQDPYRTYQTNYSPSPTQSILPALFQSLAATTMASTFSPTPAPLPTYPSPLPLAPAPTPATSATPGLTLTTADSQTPPTSPDAPQQNTSSTSPAALIIAQSARIPRRGTTLVSWTSVGMAPESCAVTQNAYAFSGGNQGSKVLPPELTANPGTLTFLFDCYSFSGTNIRRSTTITVQ